MKIQQKKLLVNLPCHFEFDSDDEIAFMCSSINLILAGKNKVKYDIMGTKGSVIIGLLYLQRDQEYQEYRNFLKKMVVDAT